MTIETPQQKADRIIRNKCYGEALQLCEAEAERNTLRSVIKNDSEIEELVRNTAKRYLTPLQVDGDSHGVPTEADIVESLCVLIDQLRTQNEELKQEVEGVNNWREELRLRKHAVECDLELLKQQNSTLLEVAKAAKELAEFSSYGEITRVVVNWGQIRKWCDLTFAALTTVREKGIEI